MLLKGFFVQVIFWSLLLNKVAKKILNKSWRMKKLSEYLPSMKLDGYSFELYQEHVDKWERQSDNQGKQGFHHT